MNLRFLLAGVLFLPAASPARLSAQDSVPTWVREHYSRRDVLIPMRDGVRLFTTIYAPKDSSERLPILLTRTPYGTDTYLRVFGPGPTFGQAGFIIVYQDVRGKYQSEGDFVNVRPFNPAKKGAEIGSTALPEKMKSLRQNGFARGPRRRRLGRLCHRPPVVSVSAAKQRYNKSSINEDVSGHNR